MSQLPRKAQIFLWMVYCLGALSFLAEFTILPFPARLDSSYQDIWLLPLFVLGASAAGHKKIQLFGKDSEAGTMSLSFAVIFATLLRFGPQGALLAGISSTFVACRIQPEEKRQTWYQAWFNICGSIIEIALGGAAFLLVNHETLALDLSHSAFAICTASLLFYFCNTLSVSTIIGLCTGEKPLAVWRESFLFAAPGYFYSALAGTAATLLFQILGHNWLVSIVTFFCVAPILFLIYASYRQEAVRRDAMVEGKERLANLYLATIRSLALAIDAKDQYTHKHILRVQQYAVATAIGMGIEGDELKAIETGALLHDIGKLGVPEYVLLKPGRLTDEEFAKIKEHPRIGADILDPVEFPWPVLPIVKYHHERLDGKGYPEGLKGDEIPRTARILAVADVYDALTSDRSYRNAWTHERALEEIRRCVGTHFDPLVVDAFAQVIDGVLDEMAAQGLGPRANHAVPSIEMEQGITTARSAVAARDIQRASTELWALYEVAQTLSASLGLQDIVAILATKLQAIFPGTGCVFLLSPNEEADPAARVLIARAAVGLGERFFAGCRTLNEQSLSLKVAWGKQSYRGPYEHDDLLPNSIADGSWRDLKTAMIVPIVHQEHVLGTINLYHPEEDIFTAYDQSLLELIGERAAMALFNGILFERTRNHALTDPLTGLANLRFLSENIEERIQQNGRHFALLCLDVDGFKPINDNFGHRKGDDVLCDLSDLFRRVGGKENIVARCGGDEFVILIDDADRHDAEQIAHRVQEAVAGYDPGLHHPRLGDLRVGVSIGTACFPEDGSDGTALLSTADSRMYANKTEHKLGHMAGTEIPLSDPLAMLAASGALTTVRRTISGGGTLYPVANDLK